MRAIVYHVVKKLHRRVHTGHTAISNIFIMWNQNSDIACMIETLFPKYISGAVVQSIVSLMSSLRSQLVKCFTIL